MCAVLLERHGRRHTLPHSTSTDTAALKAVSAWLAAVLSDTKWQSRHTARQLAPCPFMRTGLPSAECPETGPAYLEQLIANGTNAPLRLVGPATPYATSSATASTPYQVCMPQASSWCIAHTWTLASNLLSLCMIRVHRVWWPFVTVEAHVPS